MEMPPLSEDTLSNHELLVASDFSLSGLSTMSLESVLLKTPTAFIMIGHTPSHQRGANAYVDFEYSVLPAVPRLLDDSDLMCFIDSVLSHDPATAATAEEDMTARNGRGGNIRALDRTIAAVYALLL